MIYHNLSRENEQEMLTLLKQLGLLSEWFDTVQFKRDEFCKSALVETFAECIQRLFEHRFPTGHLQNLNTLPKNVQASLRTTGISDTKLNRMSIKSVFFEYIRSRQFFITQDAMMKYFTSRHPGDKKFVEIIAEFLDLTIAEQHGLFYLWAIKRKS